MTAAGIIANYRERTLSRGGVLVRFQTAQCFRVVTGLIASRSGLSAAELVELCYGDHEDGGPLYAVFNVGATARVCRHRLLQIGLAIDSGKRGRWRIRDLWADPQRLAA